MSNKTRQSSRSKKLNNSLKIVDKETRKYVINTRIDQLESDFYDSPNRLAEDSSDEFEMELEEHEKEKNNDMQKQTKKQKKAAQKVKKKKINKRTKKESSMRRNFNLKKLIKEEGLEESTQQQFPNFCSIRANTNKYPQRGFCSICGMFAKYTCPRCGEKYCRLKCHDQHKTYFCLKFDM